jgi:1,4-dihydroxy-2-naphthoate octaprenyltransferase
LYAYYETIVRANDPGRSPSAGGNGKASPDKQPVTILVAAAVGLTAVASLTALMLRELSLPPAALLVMALAFLGAVFYSTPPLRLAFSGYGELVLAILYANLLPAYAFLLQTGEFHRLLAMSTFPLTALGLALALVYELADYVSDLKRNRRTLMVRVGWQRGMALHNGMILGAFLLVGLAITFGLPLFIGLSALLPLPLGLLQIWQMRRISEGARPNWRALKLTAVMLFATTAYFLTFSYWTR